MKLLEITKNKIIPATVADAKAARQAVDAGTVLPASTETKGYSRRRALVTFGGSLGVMGAALLTGCGSGGGSISPTSSVSGATGQATMTIVWPEQSAATTKLIPIAANSIQVSILNGTTVVGNQVVARPTTGNSSTVTFDTLPVGDLIVQAQAHPNADGTGTDQASAQTSITITAGAVTPLTLTMASTIDHVTLISYDSSISVGTSTSLQLTAYDSTGATVLITSSSVTFTSLTPSIATVSSIGAATGVSAGTAQFRAIETESGKAATVNVTITAATTPTPTPSPSTSPSAGSCTLTPSDEQGPFPLLAYLNNSAVNRSNIVETQTGVPLTLNLTLVNVNGSCAPLTNAAIYIWMCNKDGQYSGYSSNQNGNHAGETYLRGLQVTNSSGAVTFNAIYPGWYTGRITHVHFEVFLNATYSSTASAKLISQLAFPQEITQAVYASSLYAAHGQNTSVAGFANDQVFRDGTTYQMLTMTGSISAGYTGSIVIGVNA